MIPPRRRGFTLVEILVSLAILAILFGLVFRPMLMGLEVLSIGRAEHRVQTEARELINTLSEDLQEAVAVYPNFSVYSLQAGAAGNASDRWRTPQRARLDLVLPARRGRTLETPIQPQVAGAVNQPKVVTYWLMRADPLRPYHPEDNPRRVFRAQHAYVASPQTAQPGQVTPPRTPDDLWAYAVSEARRTGQSLAQMGDDVAPMFAAGGPFDWYIQDIDVLGPSPALPLMRGPDPVDTSYSNAPRMAGLVTLTDTQSDVWRFELLPELAELEELDANANWTTFRGSLARWLTPYQRESDGQWTLPSSGLISRSGGPPLPIVAVIRPQGARDAAGILAEQYLLSLEQDPSQPLVGRPVLYRVDPGGDPIPVYDLTDYPNRVFAAAPGNPASAELACGINWASGEITFAFPQEDLFLPLPDPTAAQVAARQLYRPEDTVPVPTVLGGPGGAPAWWTGPLSYLDAVGTPYGNYGPYLLDEFMLEQLGAPAGVWTSYTLSSHRPPRLNSGGLTPGLGDPASDYLARQLNMSIVPGSETVTVEVYRVANPGDVPTPANLVRRVAYSPLRTLSASGVGAGDLEPLTYHLDYQTGRLTFYDPQLDADATIDRDGLNPPAAVIDPVGGGFLQPVVRVRYEYRNNLPTISQLRLGNDANRDQVVATYRSLEALALRLTLDVPTNSTRGATETVNDAMAAGPYERPEGARRRLVFESRLTVGGRR